MDIVIDVESDGPCVAKHSMVCFGAVVCDGTFDKTFYGQVAPVSDIWIPDALAVSGFTREQHLAFPDPKVTMVQFAEWLNSVNPTKQRITMWSDNNGYDWKFIDYYLHMYYGSNPMGWSSQNINSLYKGVKKDMRASFKYLRKTKHDHDPVNDAKGNAEALWEIRKLNHF